MTNKKLNYIFPKNPFQSILMTLILIVTSLLVIVLFDNYLNVFFLDSNLFSFVKDFCSYFIAFLILNLIARKKINSYPFKLSSIKIVLLVILVSICFAIAIGIPSYFFLYVNIDYSHILIVKTAKLSILGLISIIAITPLFEELIIRGIMLDGLLKNNSWKKAVIITTILFILIHFDLLKTPSLIFSGLFLGWLYYKTKNLVLTIIVHSFNNLTTSIHPYITNNDFENYKYYGEYTFLVLLFSFIIFSISLYFLIKTINNDNRR